MKKIFFLLIFSLLTTITCNLFAQIPDLSLCEILDFINKDSLKRTVQDMQNFESRLCSRATGNNKIVAQYLVNRLKMYDIENARIDSFYVSGTHWIIGSYDQYMYNVSGTLKGTGNTDSTVIIGAHLDAISYTIPEYVPTESVPGADDNATGCAVMIEMARIIHEKKIKPYHNIDFMAYDAEEIGLKGSYYDAKKRKAAEENIILMLNNDMVGTQPNDEIWEVSLQWYDNSLDIAEKTEYVLNTYTPVIPVRSDKPNSAGSDSYPYYVEKYKVIFAIEQKFSPFYHSVNDLTGFLNFEYCRQIARMNFALLDYYAGINLPLRITNENKDEHGIQVFPNPTKDIIRIHNYSDIHIGQINIYDISGRLLLSESNLQQPQNIIHLTPLHAGIYFIRIFTDKGVVNKKIIKQ